MVFTSRIEVLGVKPDFRFFFIMNQFHNDLFLKGLLYFSEDTLLYFPKNQSDSEISTDEQYFIFFRMFPNFPQTTKCEKTWFWGCGWIEAVSAVILLRVLCRKVYSFVSCMWFFTYLQFFFISRVPSRSNHYLEKVGGMYTILIGTLNVPNGPPWVETCQFVCRQAWNAALVKLGHYAEQNSHQRGS